MASESTLQANLAVLALTQPGFQLPDGDLRTRSGPEGLSLRTADGRWIHVHSRRNPEREADTLVEPIRGNGGPGTAILVGAGSGHVIEAIERACATSRVIAIEPFPGCAAELLARRDWRDWLTSGRLTLLVGPDYRGAADAWRVIDPSADRPPVLVLPVLEREFAPETTAARQVAERIVYGAEANADARRKLGGLYVRHTLENLSIVANEASVDVLDGAFAAVPAVVVAAGPSLDAAIEAIAAVRDRALIVAVDTATRSLVAAGIQPDLVVAVDPTEVNGRHLAGLAAPDRTWLVAEPSVHPAAFDAFVGRTFVFRVADHQPWPWFNAHGLDCGRLRAWGSVLTSALDLALKLGCDPIAFVGADLAYPGRQPYCRGTMFEEGWTERVAEGETLEEIWADSIGRRHRVRAADVHGETILSTPHLVSFRDWIVGETKQHSKRRFINATGGGILVGGSLAQSAPASLSGDLPAVLVDRSSIARLHRLGLRRAGSARAVEELAAAGPDQAMLVAWREVLPEPEIESILAAVRHPKARASRAEPADDRRRWRIRRPERVSLLRRAALGQPDASTTTIANPYGSRDAARAAAWRALSRLLDPATLATAPTLDPRPGALGPNMVPTSRPIWGAATAATAELEDALVGTLVGEEGAGTCEPIVAIPAGCRHHPDDSWATEPAGRLGTRLALLWSWLATVAASDDGRRAARWLERLWRTLAEPAAGVDGAHAPSFSTTFSIAFADGRSVSTRTSAGLPRHCAALTGAAAVQDAAGAGSSGHVVLAEPHRPRGTEPAVVVELTCASETGAPWLDPNAHWLEPRNLRDDGLPLCLVAGRLDDESALVTAAGGTVSYRVREDGRFEEAGRWPLPISGEVHLADGRAIAWHNDPTSRLMVKREPGAGPDITPIPFHASLAFPRPDGSVWFTGFNGGLWRWREAAGWDLLVQTPPLIGLHEEGDAFRLDPAGFDGPLYTGWRWRPGAADAAPVPLGSEAQSWSSSRRGAWVAFAHPHADIVRLRHDSGRLVTVSCVAPFNVAWAGRSLVVTSCLGTAFVLLFRDLATWLETHAQH
jgi:hypothetical protein